jgi:hypothetical protein
VKPSSPTPSPRLVRAAAAERSDLERHRRTLLDRRERLRSELDEVGAALAETDERLRLIDRIIGSPDPTARGADQLHQHPSPPEPVKRRKDDDERANPTTAPALRGPHIRRVAVALALARPDRPEALHYREWFGLLREAGYEVAGKDPLAVFLTQLGRSPVVRRGTQAGVYELDLAAPQRLRRRLDDLQAQLRTLTAVAPSATTDLSAIRTRRTALALKIGQLERSLQEAQEALQGAPDGEAVTLAATG